MGVVVNGPEKGGFRDYLSINTAARQNGRNLRKQSEMSSWRARTPSLSRWTSRRWSAKINNFKGTAHDVESMGTRQETVERKQNTCKTIRWSGMHDKGKGKGKNRNKGKGKHHGKEGKNGFHEMEGHDETQDMQNQLRLHRTDAHRLGSC